MMSIHKNIIYNKFLSPFTSYLIVQGAWFAAFGLQTVLFPYLAANVLQLSPTLLSVAQMTLTAPAFILLFFGGVIAERADRRILLVVLHFMAFSPPLILAALIFKGHLTFLAMVFFGLSMGSIGAIVMPARDAALNAIVAQTKGMTVQRAVVWSSLAQFGAQILGMALAAFSPGHIEPYILLGIEAIIIGFGGLAALAFPRLTRASDQALKDDKFKEPRAAVSMWQQMRDGMNAVIQSPIIGSLTLLMMAIGVFVMGSFFVLLPLLVRDVYLGGLRELSLVYLVFWCGALAGVILLALNSQIEKPGQTLILSVLVSAAALGILAFPIPYWLFLVLMFLWGGSAGIGVSMSRSIVQETAPVDKLARVLSIYQFGFLGGAPIGTLVIGLIISGIGLTFAPLFPMLGLLCALLWLSLFSPIISFKNNEVTTANDGQNTNP